MPTRLLSTPVDPFTTTTIKDISTTIDPRLGALLASIAGLHRLNSVLSEALAELAALRASKWTAPTFEVVAYPPSRTFVVAYADVFAGKSALELCWKMCVRVQKLSRRITVLTDYVAKGNKHLRAQLKENLLEKQIAYRCFETRVAGIRAYQQALRTGCSLENAVFAGLTAERKAIGVYNPIKNSLDYLTLEVSEVKASGAQKRFKKDTGYRPCPGICLPKPGVRFNEVTPADVDWAMRQQAFPHSEGMPRAAKNWDADRRIYVQENWQPRESSTSSLYAKLVADYAEKNLKGLEEAREFQRIHSKKYDLNPFETKFFNRRDSIVNSFEVWEEAGHPTIVEGYFTAEGELVGTFQIAEEVTRATASPASRNTKRPERYVAPITAKCLWCGGVVTKRKGTRHCGDICKKEHWKQCGADCPKSHWKEDKAA